MKFINRRDWIPSSTAVLCEKHFEEKFISGGKKCNLKWKCNPIPTIHSEQSLKRPSTLPTPVVSRKLPKIRVKQEDEIKPFLQNDRILAFSTLTESHSPEGFSCKKTPECIVFYNLVFDPDTGFPNILNQSELTRNYMYSCSIMEIMFLFHLGLLKEGVPD